MKALHKLFIFLFLLSTINLVNANGLSIENPSIEINKTNGIESIFKINLTNQETFTFYNITSNNPLLQFDKFDLSSGETKNFNVKITSNENFNGEIKIIGEYFADLGTSNKTEEIIIDQNGADICNLDLIEGDSIKWTNSLQGEIKLKNINNNQEIATIQGGQTYTNKFENPIEFDYQVFKVGLPLSNPCHLNIRPTSGYIHSSEFDAPLSLKLNLIFDPTTIQVITLTNSYSLNYNGETEDILTIKNTGDKIAKNVHLEAQWFSFSENNFDLNIGQSKNIGYTITPLIFNTTQTNKTYNIDLKVSGNFQEITRPYSVFINYNEFISLFDGLSLDLESVKTLASLICLQYPDLKGFCVGGGNSGNESDRNVTITVNEETYKEKILSDDIFQESSKQNDNLQNERLSAIESKVENNSIDIVRKELESRSEEIQNNIGTMLFLMIGLLFIFLVFIFLVILQTEKGRSLVKNLAKYHKGEKTL